MDVIKLAVLNHLKDTPKPKEGVQSFHYVLNIHDVDAGTDYWNELKGTLSQGPPEMVAPTVSISWTTVCAELLRSCGVVGDAALGKLRDAITKTLTTDVELDTVLKQSGKSVADSVDRLKKELIATLPKVSREGKTKIAQAELFVGVIGLEPERKEVKV